ncbi:hypothetical protein GGD70_002742 [Paraburkholderia fungorum]|nr:hypothetical protein [Paraburkholderia fungorum]
MWTELAKRTLAKHERRNFVPAVATDSADENEMIASIVHGHILAFEMCSRASDQRNTVMTIDGLDAGEALVARSRKTRANVSLRASEHIDGKITTTLECLYVWRAARKAPENQGRLDRNRGK